MSHDMSGITQEIELGLSIEAFLSSNVGLFLLDRARDEAIAAVDELKVASPSDEPEIRRLQNIIRRAEGFEIWLIEGLQQGKIMEMQLELSQASD